jgi:hypothetical protein
MSFPLRYILALALLVAPLPLRAQPASYDAAKAFFSLFSPQRLTRISIQWAIGALRTEMEITYQGLTVSPDGREAYLTDVSLTPNMPWDVRRECRITADRIDISETGGPDDLRLHQEFIGVAVAPQCLDPTAADTFAAAGYERLAVDRLFVDLDYAFASSALDVTLHAAIRDALVIEAAAELDYIWLRRADPYAADPYSMGAEAEPVFALSALELRIEDAGMLDALRPILPTMGMEIEAIPAMVEGALRDALAPADGQNLSANAAAFAGNARLATEAFLAEGGAITIAARPQRPLWLSPQSLAFPDAVIEALALEASAGPLRARSRIDPALVQAAVSGDPGAMNAEDARAVAEHLMQGLGGPKALAAGRTLLTPLAEGGDAEAALILARALAASDPASAYRHGLFAATERPGALALLDAAEAALPLADILVAQAAAETPDADARDAATVAAADIAALRRAALAYLVGGGPARSYVRAYAMASLAAAAGDRASVDLRARLTRRLAARGGEDAALWDRTAADLADAALGAWLDGGLAAELSR